MSGSHGRQPSMAIPANRLGQVNNIINKWGYILPTYRKILLGVYPFAFVFSIASFVISCFVLKPSLSEVANTYKTPITPNPHAIIAFTGIIYATQIGYYIWSVIMKETARTERDREDKFIACTIALFMSIANLAMGLWALACTKEWFLLATLLQGAVLLSLIPPNIVLLLYHPQPREWIDEILIYAPHRFFIVLSANILFLVTMIAAIRLDYDPVPAPGTNSGRVLGAVFAGVNAVEAIAVLFDTDVSLALAATAASVSVALGSSAPKAVKIPALAFAGIHPAALGASFLWEFLDSRVPKIRLNTDPA